MKVYIVVKTQRNLLNDITWLPSTRIIDIDSVWLDFLSVQLYIESKNKNATEYTYELKTKQVKQ